jgi:hypothetical protein
MKEIEPMADPSSPFQFEDVPLDEARRMGQEKPAKGHVTS